MKKTAIFGLLIVLLAGAALAQAQDKAQSKKVLIVNTATKCSLSPQFHALQELYDQYADQGLIIISFPSNDFGRREPGNNETIKKTCDSRFGIKFPIMEKITVEGDDMHPVYQWLTQMDKNGIKDSEVRWNFQKYLINENGILIDVLEPMKKPNGKSVLEWLEK